MFIVNSSVTYTAGVPGAALACGQRLSGSVTCVRAKFVSVAEGFWLEKIGAHKGLGLCLCLIQGKSGGTEGGGVDGGCQLVLMTSSWPTSTATPISATNGTMSSATR